MHTLPASVFAPELLAAVVASLDDPVVVVSRGGVIVGVNPAFTRVTGYSAEEALGCTPHLLSSGLHDARFFEGLWTTIRRGDTWHGHILNRRKNGALYTDDTRITPIAGDDGQPAWYVVRKRDVGSSWAALAGPSPVGTFRADARGRWTFVDLTTLALLDLLPAEAMGLGWLDAIAVHEVGAVRAAWAGATSTGLGLTLRFRTIGPIERSLQLHARPADDGPAGFVGAVEDVTPLSEAVAESERAQAWAQALLQHASDVLGLVGHDGHVTYASPSLSRVLGVHPSAVLGRHVRELLHHDDLARARVSIGWPVEVRARHADGRWKRLDVMITDRRADPVVGAYVVSARDVTEQRHLEERLRHDATHDQLTGLANRQRLVQTIEQSLAGRAADDEPAALLVCDLDGVGLVNDTLGHEAGDVVLRLIADRLRAAVRGPERVGGPDLVARLVGDELVVFLSAIADRATARRVGERIAERARRPLVVHGTTVSIGARVCVCVVPGPVDVDGLLRRASEALSSSRNGQSTPTLVELDTP